jgi:DNA-binding transcriptional LysR family regulator
MAGVKQLPVAGGQPPVASAIIIRMRLQQLRYFLAVIDEGGFTRAAQHLGRTQQAISKALGLLEQELGVRLLDRAAGSPGPTVFGRELATFARRVLSDEAELKMRLSAVALANTGIVRIGASPTVSASLIAPAVATLAARHPALEVNVLDGIQPKLLQGLIDGSADVAVYIRTVNKADTDAQIVSEILAHEDYRIIAAPCHPLAQRAGSVSTRELAAVAWLLGSDSGDLDAAWREAFESAGLAPPSARVLTTSVEFARSLLLNGTHIMILPLGLVADALERGELLAIDAPQFAWQRPVVMSYRVEPAPTPGVLAAIHALQLAADTLSAPDDHSC